MTKPVGSDIILSQIDTMRCQWKELEHKGGQRLVHDTCFVHTAVEQKFTAWKISEEIRAHSPFHC